jgi:chromosome segregation ATPase
MNTEKIRNKLIELHNQENDMNKEMGNINKQIFLLQKEKEKITKRISGNMKFRNRLINQL